MVTPLYIYGEVLISLLDNAELDRQSEPNRNGLAFVVGRRELLELPHYINGCLVALFRESCLYDNLTYTSILIYNEAEYDCPLKLLVHRNSRIDEVKAYVHQ